MEAIASMRGGVRGSTQGSWRPLAASTVSFPVKSAVSCAPDFKSQFSETFTLNID